MTVIDTQEIRRREHALEVAKQTGDYDKIRDAANALADAENALADEADRFPESESFGTHSRPPHENPKDSGSTGPRRFAQQSGPRLASGRR